MTLISNKYKFIYIKTCRTSSTATQLYLEKFCDEKYEKSKKVPGVYNSDELYNHSNALEIKDYLYKNNRGHIWETYKKITVIRDLYANIYSNYGWRLLRKNGIQYDNVNNFIENEDINDIIKRGIYNMICINHKVIIDKFIIYENYDKSMNELLLYLEIDEKYVSKPKLYNFISQHDSDKYSEVFNEKSYQIINKSILFKKCMLIPDFKKNYSIKKK